MPRWLLAVVLAMCSFPAVLAVAPARPQGFTATVAGTTVTLAWMPPSSGEVPSTYIVEGALSPAGAPIASVPVNGTSLVVPQVPAGVYYVRVRAVNADGSSEASNEVTITVPSGSSGCASPPNQPLNLTASTTGNLLRLAWNAPNGGCPPADYVVRAGSAAGTSNIASVNVGTLLGLSATAPNGTYYLRVLAANNFGVSVPSNETIVTVGAVTPGPSAISPSSYANFKQIGLTAQTLPGFRGNARAYGDFLGNGQIDLFTAQTTYVAALPASAATPAAYDFWRHDSVQGWVRDTSHLTGAPGCIAPRKAIVADFNADGKKDIFIACHGYDAEPYPGERNDIVLSQPDGTYRVQAAGPHIAYFHGASSADVNGDGLPDVVVAIGADRTSALVLLINQGNGTFSADYSRLPRGLSSKGYYTVEFLDVNGDGLADLVYGGHEWASSPTTIVINPGNFDFSSAPQLTIPPVPGEGVVLDFLLTGAGPSASLWVLRTSGGDGTFYASRTLQRVRLASLSSEVVFSQRPARWVDWIISSTVGGQSVITSDNAAAGFSVLQPQ